MFSCEFCSKEYNTAQGLGNHKKYCDLNPNKEIYQKERTVNCSCKFCGKIYNSLNGLHQHEIRCRKNSNRLVSIKYGFDNFKNYREMFGSWNKGLTKETDNRVAKSAMTNYLHYLDGTNIPSFKGKHHTEQTKQKISKALLVADHSNKDRFSHGRKGWFDGIFFMSTWELAYYIYMRDTGHKIERCSQRFKYNYNGKDHYYTPDFIVDGHIIEIKGYEHEIDLVKYNAIDNITVLYNKDIDKAIEYVKSKYNISRIEDLSFLYKIGS